MSDLQRGTHRPFISFSYVTTIHSPVMGMSIYRAGEDITTIRKNQQGLIMRENEHAETENKIGGDSEIAPHCTHFWLCEGGGVSTTVEAFGGHACGKVAGLRRAPRRDSVG